MKKNIFLFSAFFLAGCLAFAQKRPVYTFGNKIYFEFVTTDTRMMVRQPSIFAARDSNVNEVLDFLHSPYDGVTDKKTPKSPILLGVKLDPDVSEFSGAQLRSITKSYSTYLISQGSPASLIALGIDKDNIDDYVYHAVEDDSIELVPWSKIPGLNRTMGPGSRMHPLEHSTCPATK